MIANNLMDYFWVFTAFFDAFFILLFGWLLFWVLHICLIRSIFEQSETLTYIQPNDEEQGIMVMILKLF